MSVNFETDDFPEKITKFCYDFFDSLPKTGKPNLNEWTVLSCVVKSHKGEKLEVVSLGTGSKCIGQTKLNNQGIILNDSHAEVLARRGFMRYTYEQIELALKSQISIFSINEEGNVSLLPDVHFHFFSSHLPCGDASILKDRNDSPLIQNTGAKCVNKDLNSTNDRTDPLLGQVRTKPGKGDPTLSVSCSDKLAKWIRLGFQGALIDLLLLQPLTIETITIANDSPLCKDSLRRAIVTRENSIIEDDVIRNEIEPLKLPLIFQSNIMFRYGKQDGKDPSFTSIVWCNVRKKNLEVAVEGIKLGITKKHASTAKAALMVSRYHMFTNFMLLLKLFNQRMKKKLTKHCNGKEVSYIKLKKVSSRYNNKWKLVKKHFFKTWPVKQKEDLKIQSE